MRPFQFTNADGQQNASFQFPGSLKNLQRFAQEALGHNSKAVHRAYAKRALMKIPSLEKYERQATDKII
jgi:hypothetical protein